MLSQELIQKHNMFQYATLILILHVVPPNIYEVTSYHNLHEINEYSADNL